MSVGTDIDYKYPNPGPSPEKENEITPQSGFATNFWYLFASTNLDDRSDDYHGRLDKFRQLLKTSLIYRNFPYAV